MDEEATPWEGDARATLQRLPWVEATLALWAQGWEPPVLAQGFAPYRGRRFEDTRRFARGVEVRGAALGEPEGSGRQRLARAREQETWPTSSAAGSGQ